MEIGAVADDLYGLPPADFTAARNAYADQANRAKDRKLAAEIRKLHRPTSAAWLANLMVRERPEEVAPLLDLGRALRQAQDEFAGQELRELSARRGEIVTALARQARKAAADAGQPVGDETVRELEQTLRAVLADEAAADLFARGRLTTALVPSTVLPSGIADGQPRQQPTPEPESTKPSRHTPSRAEEADQRRLREAREAAEVADRDAREQGAAATRIEKTLRRLVTARERRQDKADRAAQALAQAQDDLKRAEHDERQARADLAAAEQHADAARDRAGAAAARVETLETRTAR